MAKIEADAIINRPAVEVWSFITNFENSPKWLSSEWKLEQTSEGPVGVGTIGKFSGRMLRRNVETSFRVTDFEPNRKFVMKFMNGIAEKLRVKVTETVEPFEDGKTKLTKVIEAESRGLWKLLQPLAIWSYRKDFGEEEVARMKRALEA